MAQEISNVNESYYDNLARDDGTLRIVEVGATIDHGDEDDITNFVEAYMADLTEVAPGITIQSLLAGGRMRQTSAGIITLQLVEEDETEDAAKQGLMRTFMVLAMVSGRFRIKEGLQKMMFPDPLDQSYPATNPTVPTAWWDALDGVAPWDASPMLPASGNPWQPEDFPEWIALISA